MERVTFPGDLPVGENAIAPGVGNRRLECRHMFGEQRLLVIVDMEICKRGKTFLIVILSWDGYIIPIGDGSAFRELVIVGGRCSVGEPDKHIEAEIIPMIASAAETAERHNVIVHMRDID